MTNPTELPSLVALQSFDAALRHRSFTRAAAELHRTQGAVSRQVALLERKLGVRLFERDHPRVRPTPAAEVFGTKVRSVLNRLSAILLELQASGGVGGVLNLAILPTFGTRWLIPRLGEFYAEHPEISLNLTTRIGAFDFETDELDAAVHYGEGHWPGGEVVPLMAEDVVVVASRDYVRAAKLRRPSDLVGKPLLQLESRLGAWDEWFRAVGLGGVDGRHGPRFEHHLMVIQAAIAGLGVALLPEFLVRDELAAKALINPFPRRRPVRMSRGYWLAFPSRCRELPALTAFAGWLERRLREDGLGSDA